MNAAAKEHLYADTVVVDTRLARQAIRTQPCFTANLGEIVRLSDVSTESDVG
ncbi:hypothetical protein ACIBG0_28830 [Nocardia sp. NPDC050630]|uniref:hypothetical protein n=1 Tax=Nocardia sp. NPDC050630 TaxID=3364321 RepID=UPI0037AC3EC9